MTSAKIKPVTRSSGVTRNAKARWEKVCKFIAPVVRPFSGSTARQPSAPPTNAMQSASKTNDITTLPVPKPSARMAAISRARSATAEYIVFSAPKTAPMPMTAATMEPRTRINVEIWRDCLS